MPCYHPLTCKYDPEEKKVYFPRTPGWIPRRAKTINLPCGRCRGCRREYARQWAVRCHHEATMHKHNCFLTLTFNKENLPPDGSLNVATFQNFMKKVRNHTKISSLRYFHCGEYGERFGRPHYHVLLFGYDFADKRLHKLTTKKHKLYTSHQLKKLWPFGHSYIGDVTFESASYVARYIFKKTDDRNDIHKSLNRQPEYCTMSRRPGIGKSWYDKWGWKACHANDEIAIKRDNQMFFSKPPRYYDELLKNKDPSLYENLKNSRINKMEEPFNQPRYEGDRLSVLEECNDIQLNRQMRKLEVDS